MGERHPALSFPHPEAVEYNYHDAGHELRLIWRDPSAREIEAVRRGAARFALYTHRDVVFFLYRFGEMPWSDAPFSWHLVPEGRRRVPERAGPETRALLQVQLIESRSGTVLALRTLTLSPEFTRLLHAAIRRQSEAPWPGRASYDAQLHEAYRRFPTSAQMAKNATARTKGGD